MRDEILPPLLAVLPEYLHKACAEEAEFLAGSFSNYPPFASPVVWSSFVVIGRGWECPTLTFAKRHATVT